MVERAVTTLVGSGAFVAGSVFGWTAQKTDFCTMGALSDMVVMGDRRRFRAWMLAVAVAVIGTQALQSSGLVATAKSIYLTPNLGWAGALLGGLMFGFGMTLGGGCGNKTLVRLGGGNLKSLIVFMVLGLFAYMTQRGLIAPVRLQLEVSNLNLASFGLASQGMPDILARLSGLPAGALRPGLAVLLGGGLAAWCFKDAHFRGSHRDVTGGAVIGLLVVAGWAITGILGNDDFDPVPLASFSFVAPMGGSLQYLMSFTGSTMDFGVATVGGVIFGAFLAAKAGGRFRVEGFADTPDLIRHLLGGALMGVGGVLALGCTIGQGVTGLSTLALSSPLALGAIILGGVLGLRFLEEGSLAGALRAVFRLGLGLAVLAVPVLAVPVWAAPVAGLADACFGCHGTDGESPGAMPVLTAKSADELKAILREYRSGTREATIMDRIAKGYSEAQLDAIIDSLRQ